MRVALSLFILLLSAPGLIAGPLPFSFWKTASGGGALTLTYLTNATDGTDQTNYSFASQSIGNPGDREYVLIVAVGRSLTTNAITVSSISVGGNSATQRATQTYADSGSASIVTAIWSASVASGTTATVDVNFSAGCAGAAVFVYTINNVSSIVPFDTGGQGGSSVVSVLLDCDAPSGDSVMLGGAYSGVASDVTFSWAGIAKDAEVFWDTNRNASVAHGSYTTSGTKSIAATVGSTSIMCGVTASFQ